MAQNLFYQSMKYTTFTLGNKIFHFSNNNLMKKRFLFHNPYSLNFLSALFVIKYIAVLSQVWT